MRRLAALAALLAAALPGCGLGPGDEREGGGAEIRVTRDFGAERLATGHVDSVRDDETVMRALQRQSDVETRYGGGFVQAIDGIEGDQGRRVDWFYFVNGIEADVGAADYELEPGDVVQWDYRRWDAAMRVPAIVGAYPEPFLHGYRGKRFPIRVECEDVGAGSCREAKRRLTDAGIDANGAALGTSAGDEVLRVVVAPWGAARTVKAAETIEEGPAVSGVFARVDRTGRVELLRGDGSPRPAPPGTGLVAATALEGQGTVWIVTGPDEAATARAARLLDESALRDAFAVAATPEGPTRLPLEGEG
jgi:hypothetical protein